MISIHLLILNIVLLMSVAHATPNAFFSNVQVLDKYTDSTNCTDKDHWFVIEAELFAAKGKKDDLYVTVPEDFTSFESQFDLTYNSEIIGSVSANSSNVLTVSFLDESHDNLTTTFNFLAKLTNSSKSAITSPTIVDYTFDVSTGTSFNNTINYMAKNVSDFSSNGGIYEQNNTAWFTVDIPLSSLQGSLFFESVPDANSSFEYNNALTTFEIITDVDEFNAPVKSVPFTAARDFSDSSTIKVLFSTNVSGGKYLRIQFFSKELQSETITNILTFTKVQSGSQLSKRSIDQLSIGATLHAKSITNFDFPQDDSIEDEDETILSTESVDVGVLYSNISISTIPSVSSYIYTSSNEYTEYTSASSIEEGITLENDVSSLGSVEYSSTKTYQSSSILSSEIVLSSDVEMSSNEDSYTEETGDNTTTGTLSTVLFESESNDYKFSMSTESLSLSNPQISAQGIVGIAPEDSNLNTCSSFSSVITYTDSETANTSAKPTSLVPNTRSSTESTTAATASTVISVESSSQQTISSMASNNSSSSPLAAVATTVITSTINGVITSYTTWIPVSTLNTSATTDGIYSNNTNSFYPTTLISDTIELGTTIVTTTVDGIISSYTTFYPIETSHSMTKDIDTNVMSRDNDTTKSKASPEVITSDDVIYTQSIITSSYEGSLTTYTTFYPISTIQNSLGYDNSTATTDENTLSVVRTTVNGMVTSYTTTCLSSDNSNSQGIDAEAFSRTAHNELTYSVISSTISGKVTVFTSWYAVSTISSEPRYVNSTAVPIFTAYTPSEVTTLMNNTLTTYTTSVPYTTLTATAFTTLRQDIGNDSVLYTVVTSASKDASETHSSVSESSIKSSFKPYFNGTKSSTHITSTPKHSTLLSASVTKSAVPKTTTETVRISLAPSVEQFTSILGMTSLTTSHSSNNSTHYSVSQYEDVANVVKTKISGLIFVVLAALL